MRYDGFGCDYRTRGRIHNWLVGCCSMSFLRRIIQLRLKFAFIVYTIHWASVSVDCFDWIYFSNVLTEERIQALQGKPAPIAYGRADSPNSRRAPRQYTTSRPFILTLLGPHHLLLSQLIRATDRHAVAV